jgi:hypothetical protein
MECAIRNAVVIVTLRDALAAAACPAWSSRIDAGCRTGTVPVACSQTSLAEGRRAA